MYKGGCLSGDSQVLCIHMQLFGDSPVVYIDMHTSKPTHMCMYTIRAGVYLETHQYTHSSSSTAQRLQQPTVPLHTHRYVCACMCAYIYMDVYGCIDRCRHMYKDMVRAEARGGGARSGTVIQEQGNSRGGARVPSCCRLACCGAVVLCCLVPVSPSLYSHTSLCIHVRIYAHIYISVCVVM